MIDIIAVVTLLVWIGFLIYRYVKRMKAAVSALGESLRSELAAFGIRVVEVMPGPIETDMLAGSDRPPEALRYPDYRELAGAFRSGYERHQPWVETRPGEVDQLLIARGIDMLNFIALDPGLHYDDMEAYVRLREIPARVAVGALDPVAI